MQTVGALAQLEKATTTTQNLLGRPAEVSTWQAHAKQVQKGRAESKQQESCNSAVTLTRWWWGGGGSGDKEEGESNQGDQPLNGKQQQQEVRRGISK